MAKFTKLSLWLLREEVISSSTVESIENEHAHWLILNPAFCFPVLWARTYRDGYLCCTVYSTFLFIIANLSQKPTRGSSETTVRLQVVTLVWKRFVPLHWPLAQIVRSWWNRWSCFPEPQQSIWLCATWGSLSRTIWLWRRTNSSSLIQEIPIKSYTTNCLSVMRAWFHLLKYTCNRRVSQGSVLGSVLFSLYTRLLPDMVRVDSFFNSQGLQLHASKTAFIHI